MAYATLDQLKGQLNKDQAVTDDDVELQLYLDSAEQIMIYLRGPSASTQYTETVHSTRTGLLLLDRRPVTAVTSVTALEYALNIDIANVVIQNEYGILRSTYGRVFWGWYSVVYTAGQAAQANHTLACLIIAQHLWRVQNGGGGANYPGEADVVAVGAGFAIPRRAMELLQTDPTPATIGGFA